MKPDCIRWGGEWRSKNRLDGETRHILYEDCIPILFRTRREARAYIERTFGYIKTRPDLHVEPHGWRLPVAVRVAVARMGGK